MKNMLNLDYLSLIQLYCSIHNHHIIRTFAFSIHFTVILSVHVLSDLTIDAPVIIYTRPVLVDFISGSNLSYTRVLVSKVIFLYILASILPLNKNNDSQG